MLRCKRCCCSVSQRYFSILYFSPVFLWMIKLFKLKFLFSACAKCVKKAATMTTTAGQLHRKSIAQLTAMQTDTYIYKNIYMCICIYVCMCTHLNTHTCTRRVALSTVKWQCIKIVNFNNKQKPQTDAHSPRWTLSLPLLSSLSNCSFYSCPALFWPGRLANWLHRPFLPFPVPSSIAGSHKWRWSLEMEVEVAVEMEMKEDNDERRCCNCAHWSPGIRLISCQFQIVRHVHA